MPAAVPASLRDLLPQIEDGLRHYAWPEATEIPLLKESMDYSLFAGGKRLRPALVLMAADVFGVEAAKAMPAAVAWEMVHTYSLIHDDLPAMDDDDLRRGNPTNHVKFGEATAILAGDAMLTFAFQLLSKASQNASISLALVTLMAEAAGVRGMVGGQQDDLSAEGMEEVSLEQLKSIHRRKTGALIASALKAGAILGQASSELQNAIEDFGYVLGQAFQVTDDILDITSSAEVLGKSVGKDEATGKLTYPALMGLDGARNEATRLAREAHAMLAEIPGSERLREIIDYVVDRVS